MSRDGPVGFWVYIMANRRNGAIYTGHTDNLWQRVQQHRNGVFDGYTKKYGCKRWSGRSGMKPVTEPSAASVASRNGGGRGGCF